MKRRSKILDALFASAVWIIWCPVGCDVAAAEGLPNVAPESVGLDPQWLATIDAVVADGLAEARMPGCVILIGRHGRIASLRAYGHRAVRPEPAPMTVDTVFDLASLTKPVATATSIMLLIERGQLCLTDPVVNCIPEFAQHGKVAITIRDLLIHQSGLLPDNPLDDYLMGREVAVQRICDLDLQHPVGRKFVYSDVNFIVLGECVRRVTGHDVHEFSQTNIFQPLGMTETGFLPGDELKARAAPTEQRDGHWIRGDVHDPRAWALGGIAGHAGLFSTAEDLAIYAQMLLNRGCYKCQRILAPSTVAMMTRSYPVSSGERGLGWDRRTGYSVNRGELLSDSAFGHGGFTGTVMWIDPELDLYFIFLSNRVHPDGKGLVNPLAGQIATIIAQAVAR